MAATTENRHEEFLIIYLVDDCAPDAESPYGYGPREYYRGTLEGAKRFAGQEAFDRCYCGAEIRLRGEVVANFIGF